MGSEAETMTIKDEVWDEIWEKELDDSWDKIELMTFVVNLTLTKVKELIKKQIGDIITLVESRNKDVGDKWQRFENRKVGGYKITTLTKLLAEIGGDE